MSRRYVRRIYLAPKHPVCAERIAWHGAAKARVGHWPRTDRHLRVVHVFELGCTTADEESGENGDQGRGLGHPRYNIELHDSASAR